MKTFASAVAVCLVASTPSFAQEDLAAVGEAAPMFRLPAYNGKAIGAPVVGLDRFVGPDATDKEVKVVLLSFMASFCGPCKKEMPYLQALHERYKDLGLRVLSVSIDTEAEGQRKIDEWIAANKVTFPVLKDRFNLVARRWLGSKTPLPSVFILKPDGTVATIHRGYDKEASVLLNKDVQAALGMKRGVAAATAQNALP